MYPVIHPSPIELKFDKHLSSFFSLEGEKMKKWKSNDIDAQAAAGLVSVFALITEDFLKEIK